MNASLTSLLKLDKQQLIALLWQTDPEFWKILRSSSGTLQARDRVFDYLNAVERKFFNIYGKSQLKDLHILEKNTAKECIRVLKNLIRTENEKLTNHSALGDLFRMAVGDHKTIDKVSPGFLLEFIYLLKGIRGEAPIRRLFNQLEMKEGRAAATERSKQLDGYAGAMEAFVSKYSSGLDAPITKKREAMKGAILDYFGATSKDWTDYVWQLRHVITTLKTLEEIVALSDDERKGLVLAEKYNIPFQITPYYLSLFNGSGGDESDRSIRAQVLPSASYCINVHRNRAEEIDMDFMGERSTSPIDGITRRYSQIVILKPYDSCPQICVYCQRNWEITGIDEARLSRSKTDAAIRWISDHQHISEVLVTGGDPLTLKNRHLDDIIGKVASIPHVERIRIGTRTPVTLPFRIDGEFLDILSKYHRWGKLELNIITHVQHAAEITPEALEAVVKIKERGINVYNQQVFTYYNSRKFESCHLRKALKLCGIDPYYSFNTKGKEETVDFRVPIARIEQERKEEARMLPGIARTDEPVFNVPRLGKSHLRAWQDHEPIMILRDGSRVYRFYPWEAMITLSQDYLYMDVPIADYLQRLAADGEDVEDYSSVWYYF